MRLICFHEAIFDRPGSLLGGVGLDREHEGRALEQAGVLEHADPHAVAAGLERHLDEVLLHRELEQGAQLGEQLAEGRAEVGVRVRRQLLGQDVDREARELAGQLREASVE